MEIRNATVVCCVRAQGAAAETDPVHDATICLVVFQIGQLCAVPTITNLGGWLTGTGVRALVSNCGSVATSMIHADLQRQHTLYDHNIAGRMLDRWMAVCATV